MELMVTFRRLSDAQVRSFIPLYSWKGWQIVLAIGVTAVCIRWVMR